ncbi:MAG: beta-glucosidase BglX [Cyclobacteriaceae bacterium]
MKIQILLISIISMYMTASCTDSNNSGKGNSQTPIDEKVDSVLSLMNVDEKIGQLNMYNGSWEFTGPVPENDDSQHKADMIKSGGVGGMLNVLTVKGTRAAQKLAVENSRLGIPLIFGYDIIHGYKTMFPVPLAQAASWDEEVARAGAEVAALEGSAAGVHWTFAPMIDISRDARWGRIMESAGEDPYLTSIMGRAWIEGYQGDVLSASHTIAACAKHFAAYGYGEAGRDYNTAEISRSTLHNVILRPFKVASDAGVATFMNSFNSINGVPATASKYLQRKWLKGEWGFEGFVVSDWGSIKEMVLHGYSRDSDEAARQALEAGSDMDMESRAYENGLKKLVLESKEHSDLLDDAVRRILKLKFQLGLFDDPYKYCDEEKEKNSILTSANLEVARDAARKSIVLLKNEKELLPLSKNVSSIAVIGQLAGSKDVPLGNWRAQAIKDSGVSLFEGIEAAVSADTKVQFAEGYSLTQGQRSFINELDFVENDRSGFAEAIALAKSSEVVILALGEDCFQSGEGRSQVDIGLKGNQRELFDELIKVNKNVIVTLMNGRPLAIPEVVQNAPAILETWFLGSESGHGIADVVFGDYNPSGKLPVSFPYHVGQEPLYYARKNTGRPVPESGSYDHVVWSHYTDASNDALIPFGYGLSYTQFEYSDLKVQSQNGDLKVEFLLKNVGDIDGKETAQIYIRDLHASEIQPIKRLVKYLQINLEAGQEERITIDLGAEDLGYYNSEGEFVIEDGLFDIMVGTNSRDVMTSQLEMKF